MPQVHHSYLHKATTTVIAYDYSCKFTALLKLHPRSQKSPHALFAQRPTKQRYDTLTIQAMVVLSKMAQSSNAIEQHLNRALATTLRNRNGACVTIPVDMMQRTKFAKRWNSDTPRIENFYLKRDEFKHRLETELGTNITEEQAESFCRLIAVFAILSGYLPLLHSEATNANVQWLAWTTIWCLYEEAGKERVRKLVDKYINTELTGQSINALIQDVENAMQENRLRPQTCANDGCAHLGKSYACHKCSAIFYCSRKCQETDWPRHKSQCTQHRDYTAHKRELAKTRVPRTTQSARKGPPANSNTEPEPEIIPESMTEPDPENIEETVREVAILNQEVIPRQVHEGAAPMKHPRKKRTE